MSVETDRLVRKEVALGQIRELVANPAFIGELVAPLKTVNSDDVIFQYIAPDVDGLAPARAEDAESELAAKDDTVGSGRASIIDWAIKDHYTASDVTRYREFRRLAELAGSEAFPLTTQSMTEDFDTKLARDTASRRRKLDNRREQLVIDALYEGAITYDDGKIKFGVNYERPVGQQDQAPAALWSATASDPILDIDTMNEEMYDTHGVRLTRAFASSKVIRSVLNSDRFAARSGIAGATGGVPVDPKYLIDGWGVEAAVAVIERATGVTFTPYDAVYRTRPIGSKTVTVNRFADESKIVFLPPTDALADISELGFGATLTSPHPEGGWGSGYYEWERSTVDPWGHDKGNGIKMFPVLPHLEYSYVMKVLA